MTNNNLSIHSIKLDPDALSLALLADINFDRFDAFAEPLARALDCRVRERQWGADRHQWLLEFEGCQLWLNYEFYGDVCWLSTERQEDLEVLEYLAGLLRPYVN
jgi:hypothetical protein